MRRFLITLGFMTRIPVSQTLEYREGDLEKGIVWFPIIGLLLGAIAAILYGFFSVFLPKELAVILAILTNLCLTGAFHLDGLCDTVDGIYSARTKERMLEIMKDSHIGTNGVVALVLDLAWKYIGIYYSRVPMLTILLLPVAGKMIQGILGYKAKYPRKEGLGLFVGTVTRGRIWICYGIGVMFLSVGMSVMQGVQARTTAHLLYGGVLGIGISLVLLLFAIWFRKYIEKKIDGITGDVMGAGSELSEMVFLLLLNINGIL